ncbi:TIGR04028 family ABC transporter substrate-binding protein [Leucobacter coleopterorum]|uniref:TIGR04028 family ABC transporter substrate-binding protein n=1 Tax=Leucobacter coleopterorum TaxID=2714933 RepID=A0ABX6JU94_9MICO|nr:TIGR04028 family ABC transporter substrate-binding protein [Leucobacter coleopterorum]QIM17808.1 TIGR04028 family ABC transporter substrate-binding protein [Leucobacter coleopterorum]
MKKPRIALVGALAVVALAMTGCSASASGTDSAGGNTLTYLEPQTWNTLYPPAGGFYPNGGVLNQVTDRLLYQDPETLELEPWIAAELPEVNAEATEYTFKLRDGVTYSDGTPLDAENVVKNLDLFGKGDTKRALSVSEAINNYDRGEVIDELTVKFFFTAPSPGFAQAVSTINSGLLSNKTLDRTSEEFGPGNADKIIGSGPFVIADEKVGSELKLTTRGDYDWAPKARDHQGAAQIDGIDIVVVSEASVRVGTVVSGQADIARQIPAPDEAQFLADGLTLVAASTNGVNNSLSLRFNHPLLNDIKVRQAIIAGVDREKIVDTLFTENYPLATGILAKTALGYTDTSKYYQYDPAKAAKLLDEAGWVAGSDGIREKDGQKLSITFNEALPQPRSKEVVTLIQEQLAKIGVGVELFAGDQAAQDEARLDEDKIQVYHSMVGRADYDVLKSQFYSTNRNALLNFDTKTKTVHDTELDSLLDQVASVPTTEERQKASAAAQQRLAEQAYVLPLFEEPQVFGLRSSVKGFHTESIGRPSFYDITLGK